MSFFGLENSGNARDGPLDFEESYKGYGEHELEENDYLNDETFGDNVQVGTDFDFGNPHSSGSSGNAIGGNGVGATARSYVAATAEGISGPRTDGTAAAGPLDLKPMESLWSTAPPPAMAPSPQSTMAPAPAPQQMAPLQPILSMQDLERQQRQMQQQFMNFHAMGHPQGPPQQQFPMQPASGQPGPSQFAPPPPPPGVNVNMNQMPMGPVQVPVQASPSPIGMSNTPSPGPVVGATKMPLQSGRRSKRDLSPEEQRRLQIRHAKVEKILKYSGLMTPRDKDFITRYQLSQIVTEDPYNEDFYFQVYKIIQRGGITSESNKGLIARAYLEHSGHRLGGRYKRTDIALQRMQSQVEKAVTVAKERPSKLKDQQAAVGNSSQDNKQANTVLGKISSTLNSKNPRRQLQIPRQQPSDPDALKDVTDSLTNVDLASSGSSSTGSSAAAVASKQRRRSSYAFNNGNGATNLNKSGGKKFILELIETVYEEILDLEANLRNGQQTDSTAMWEALHIDDSSYDVNPFISMLSFDKGIKIMPRIFNFLDKQQKLKILQKIFNELSHLQIIILSSYKTTPKPTLTQLKKVDLFQMIILKIIVSFLSNNSNFIEIMGLLLQLIRNNNVSFLTTSKIGLNLITILISRAALIKQDSSRSNILSSPEISTWNEIYDKLFTSLESKIQLIFPPREYNDHIMRLQNDKFMDEAYIWQFLASLALSGKLNHQRIIIDEVRDEIFATINEAETLQKKEKELSVLPQRSQELDTELKSIIYNKEKLYQDLNLFLNVMGLVYRDGEISELK
ncbi:CRE_collapsed_G0006160.mRNA.1.CDS.1 [Saccharomyces cerevisiae]|nr:CRE_HP_G0020600.mRNA.1.CDS.1 [Saccharomyces cerevisiae]CAI5024131.1 CRE_HP_G0095580.mRNA.1.CDS.1 [Saccharomyces cerevisiae]CAI5100370.1 CRE_HP_G0003660.mRNA.1.CDS.1 [Saccharomyces cerevisiae]CAI6458459.1 CRE_HP_G0020600.mRNA.1.CDS.1 [Saccharomyces cerevisiae]CAI6941061.1 CRE_HP_G0095580.mRNA.1.CDS.1 [Saccharomyces cerevisiae]